jgi:large subunit ribosomal protein L6e
MGCAMIAKSIPKAGRAKSYHRRGLWAIKKKNGGKFPTHPKKTAAAKAAEKTSKFYPADDVKKPLNRNANTSKPTKLRESLVPGAVLIILAGRFRGKRCVFLKQLESGLLLVTGPFKVNGVPLRRVNHAYVIGTSTKVDVSSVDVKKFDDKYFTAGKPAKKTKGEDGFFTTAEAKKELSADRIADQKAIDAKLMPIIAKTADLKSYLGARFSLKSGMKPHEMQF